MTQINRRTETMVIYVTQISDCGPGDVEWNPWQDMSESEPCTDLLDAIGKAELFRYFLEHGRYPDAYQEKLKGDPFGMLNVALAEAVHRDVVANQKRCGYRSRVRIVKRTFVTEITDEEVDPAAALKYGVKK